MKNDKKKTGALCVALRQMSKVVGRRSTSPFGKGMFSRPGDVVIENT